MLLPSAVHSSDDDDALVDNREKVVVAMSYTQTSLFWPSLTPTAIRRSSGDSLGLKKPRDCARMGRMLFKGSVHTNWLCIPPRDVTRAPPAEMNTPEFPLLPPTTGTGSRTGTGLPVTDPLSTSSATAMSEPSACTKTSLPSSTDSGRIPFTPNGLT